MHLTEQVDILYGKLFKLRILLPPIATVCEHPAQRTEYTRVMRLWHLTQAPLVLPCDLVTSQGTNEIPSWHLPVYSPPPRPTLSWGPLSLCLGSPPDWLSLLRGYHDITQIQSTYSHRWELINFILLLFKYMQTEVSQFCAFQRVCSGSR